MNKEGWSYGSSKSLWSIIVAAACLLVGGLPLLKNLGVTFLNALPPFLFIGTVAKAMLLIGGLFLLWDSFSVRNRVTFRVRSSGVIAGILLAVLGIIPLLLEFRLLAFLPFLATLDIPPSVVQALLVFYGLYLIVDAFVMSPRYY